MENNLVITINELYLLKNKKIDCCLLYTSTKATIDSSGTTAVAGTIVKLN